MFFKRSSRISMLSISILLALYLAGCASTSNLASGSSGTSGSGSSGSGSTGSGGSGSGTSGSGSTSSSGTGPTTSSAVVSTYVPSSSSPVSSDFFGMTIHYLVPSGSRQQTPFPAYSLSTLRFWGVVDWSIIQPSQGTYSWSKMDSIIATAHQNTVNDFVFSFGMVPAWASTNPTDPCLGSDGTGNAGSCSPPDLTALDQFATNLVQRYCGVVKYYEPWSEADLKHFWDGDNQQLLTVTQHIYSIAKDPANCGCTNGVCSPNGGENPNSVLTPPISTPSSSNALNWLKSYLSAAGATYPYADIAAFHGYGATVPEQTIAQIAQLKSIFAQAGLGNLPLWNTEASWGKITTALTDDQATWVMRYHLAQLAAGVSRFIWYAYDNCTWGTLYVNPSCGNTAGTEGSQTSAGDSYGVVQQWLLGATLSQCTTYQNGLWMCELTRSGGYTAWMVWNTSSSNVSVTIPQASGLTVYRDWQNNVNALPSTVSVSSYPMLLETTDL